MKLRYVLGVTSVLTTAGLLGGVIGLGVDNLNKSSTISRLDEELVNKKYVPVPYESKLVSNGHSPAYPSPGYEN